jgi:hypothetical protein
MVLIEVYDVLYEKYITGESKYNSAEVDMVNDILNTIYEMYVAALDDFESSYGGTE